MAKSNGNSDVVLRELMRQRNVEVSLDDLTDATKLTRSQVTMAISNLAKSSNINKPRRGWYVYRGPLAAAKHEAIVPHKAKAVVTALLADGRVLVTIEGVLYVASELVVE